jgi:hypothetical protein
LASTGLPALIAARTRSAVAFAYFSESSSSAGTSVCFGSPSRASRSCHATRSASTRACAVAGSFASHFSHPSALSVASAWSTLSPPAVGGGVWIVCPCHSSASGVTSAGLYAARSAAVTNPPFFLNAAATASAMSPL